MELAIGAPDKTGVDAKAERFGRTFALIRRAVEDHVIYSSIYNSIYSIFGSTVVEGIQSKAAQLGTNRASFGAAMWVRINVRERRAAKARRERCWVDNE